MEFSSKFEAKTIESQVREYLDSADLRGQITESDRREKIRFIEGPPTMNGSPHAGHLRGRVIKDLWYRLNTLRGMQIEFNAGWDTQGLPVELQAEKELGVTGGKTQAIEEFGVERIVAECKKVVAKYTKEWVNVDRMLGISLDHDRAYRTLDDAFIEREWKVLQSALEDGNIREDHTVIAYCPSCQTSLSHAEVGQGYRETVDPSLYYTVRLESDRKDGSLHDAHLVVWTTMPFTLITDAMVGVHPDEDYVHVRVDDNEQTWVVGKTRLEGFLAEIGARDFYILGATRGAELEGMRYVHPLLDLIDGLAGMVKTHPAKYHKVVAEDFVDVNAGSGLVHIAPANGEEDIRVARERNVEIFSPIDDTVKFTGEAGARYGGLYVRDADDIIVEDLRERGSLVRISSIRHSYPHCWRSGHALVWLARRGFFYDTAKIGERTTRAAGEVEYFFEPPKNRFLGIINDRHPWCISRERIWGCPLPAWRCAECGDLTWHFSRKSIIAGAAALPDGPKFELHKPWMDRITVHCQTCGSPDTQREDFVLDTWHNSGSAPWSSLDDDEYKNEIPVPFLTEGIDQTRGWAYTLLLENVILQKDAVAPFKSFLFQGHVLDKNGQKMSKSKGNVLGGGELLSKYSVDAIRFYFMWKASPIEPLNFSIDEVMARPYKMLGILYNLHLYYRQNSTYDGFDGSTHTISWAAEQGQLKESESWLLSKLQKLIRTVTEKNESCRYHEAMRALDDYVVNTFSQTYVRMTRGDIWNEDDENRDRRLAVYAVLHHVLRVIDVMMHPVCPYITEYLWQTAFVGAGKETGTHSDGGAASILLASWPIYDGGMVDDNLEMSFDAMINVISASGAARTTNQLKGRWPLDEAIICVRGTTRERLSPLVGMLRKQINVERVRIVEISQWGTGAAHVLEMHRSGIPIVVTARLNARSVGPKAKHHMGALVRKFQDADPILVAQSLQEHRTYDVVITEDNNNITLDEDDITIGYEAADGFALSARGGDSAAAAIDSDHSDTSCVVLLSTTRNRELTARGLVKDVARRIQSLRKEIGYNPTDILKRASITGLEGEPLEMLQERTEELAFLVRVRAVDFEETCSVYKDEDVDGQKIRISVE